MRIALKDLERQVSELEQAFKTLTAPGLAWRIPLEPAERAALAPGQRIVEDSYEKGEGKLAKTVMRWERITSDPSDRGRTFPEGGWSRKAIREYQAYNANALYHPSPVDRVVWKLGRRLPGQADQPPSSVLPENGSGGEASPAAGMGEICEASRHVRNGERKPDFDPDEEPDDDDQDDEDLTPGWTHVFSGGTMRKSENWPFD